MKRFRAHNLAAVWWRNCKFFFVGEGNSPSPKDALNEHWLTSLLCCDGTRRELSVSRRPVRARRDCRAAPMSHLYLPGVSLSPAVSVHDPPYKYKQSKVSKRGVAVRKGNATQPHIAAGTHMPCRITQCYLPPVRGDIPAFTPSRSWYFI